MTIGIVIRNWVEHEVRESIRLDGKLLGDPHREGG